MTELIDVLHGRSDFYRMLSSFYIKPLTQEQIDNLAGKDFSLFGAGDQLLTEGFNDISRYLRKRNTGTRQELAIDFTSCFEGTKAYQGRSAVPYESVFRSETGLLMQGPRNEVFNIYKKAAVKLREDLHLPDDHLAFELEFMAILSDRTAEALRQDDTEAALEQLETAADFLEGHLLSWFTNLAELAGKMIATRFYRGVLKITQGYLELDAETIEELFEVVESGEVVAEVEA